MNFGEVLTRAWNIIWKNKILWLFGLLASLGGGTGSGTSNFRINNQSGQQFPFPGLERFVNNIPAWVILLLILLGLTLAVIFIIIATLGRIGLLRGAWLADSGETGLSFGRLFAESRRYFWRVLLLGLLIFGISLSLILIIAIPSVLATALTFGLFLICLLPLICLLVPVFIALTIVFDLAIIAVVGEDLGVIDGLRCGWEVFRSHLAEIVVIGLILVIGSAVIGFIASLPALATLIPLMTTVFSSTGRIAIAGMAVSLVLFLIYLPVLLLVRAIMTAYMDTTWTVTFRRLTGRTPGISAQSELPAQSALE